MLRKIIQALSVLLCLGLFIYCYGDGTTKDVVFWGILLLLNFISVSTHRIIGE